MIVRIYPSKEQKQLLARQFGCSRFWWNRSLALQYEHRTNNERWLKRTELNAMLPSLKKELPWLKTDCYSQVLQATSKHLEQALKNWFEGRAKKPRFKAKSNRQSISFPQNVKVVGSQIKVPKVGLIDAIITKEIEGTIKTVTISVTPSGKYDRICWFRRGITRTTNFNRWGCYWYRFRVKRLCDLPNMELIVIQSSIPSG